MSPGTPGHDRAGSARAGASGAVGVGRVVAHTEVEEVSQVSLARALSVESARGLGLDHHLVDRVALVATELAANLHLHAERGQFLVLEGDAGLTLVALDSGPGVADFARCTEDGYSTRGTMGTGLGAVRRLSDHVDFFSQVGLGTVVTATFGGGAPASAPDVAAVGLPIRGELRNGDACGAWEGSGALVLMLADGLGHGDLAADAAEAAVRAFHACLDSGGAAQGPVAVIGDISTRLEGTRGAAVSLVQLARDGLVDGGAVRTAGLGNVSILVAGQDGESRRVASSYGTAGVRSGRSVEMTQDLPAEGVVVLHSDGLTSRWQLAGRAELLRRSAAVIAAVLWRDHIRGSDDSLVLVAKAPQP